MKKILVVVAILTFAACGCGYTTKSLLPSNFEKLMKEIEKVAEAIGRTL